MKRQTTTAVLAAALVFVCVFLMPEGAPAQEGGADLAAKLQNPVADLISVPLQNNWDFGIGPEDAMRYTLNVQPVIPVSISARWNLITRTIVPVIHAEAPVIGQADHTGLGDILQSFFFSPKEPISGGWILGAGPAILYPSGSAGFSQDKWGTGPTAVVLKQESGWTYGMLANHVWSVSGVGANHISSTFIQPFVSYTTKKQTTYGFNTESMYDWKVEQWTLPINLAVSQLMKIGGMPMQFQLGGRSYVEDLDNGPECGIRFTVTFLFPK